MTLRRVVAPTDFPVTLVEVKSHLRVEVDTEDDLLAIYIAAATAHAERYTGQAFAAQTWDEVLDAFPEAEIQLTRGPVASVDSVNYIDEDGAEQVVDSGDYEVDTVLPYGWVVPAADIPWPTTMETINAVWVRFVVGEIAHEDVKHALLLIVGHWYQNRESASADNLREVPLGAMALLSLHRRMFV